MCKKKCSEDYWQRVLQTGYIILVYISSVCTLASFTLLQTNDQGRIFQGIVESIKGPTMLDLARFFGTSVSVISFMFVFFVGGSAVGSLACKALNQGVSKRLKKVLEKQPIFFSDR